MLMAEGVRNGGNRAETKKLLSSADWFDELPMHAVAISDAMLLPDSGRPSITPF